MEGRLNLVNSYSFACGPDIQCCFVLGVFRAVKCEHERATCITYSAGHILPVIVALRTTDATYTNQTNMFHFFAEAVYSKLFSKR